LVIFHGWPGRCCRIPEVPLMMARHCGSSGTDCVGHAAS
jgi:hypothetical protein